MSDKNLKTWQAEIARLLHEHQVRDQHGLAAFTDALSQATDYTNARDGLAKKAEEARSAYRRWLVAESDHYSAILIGWPPGHRTPVHDHDGLWGIELVLAGSLHVDEFKTVGAAVKPVRSVDLVRDKAVIFEDIAYAHACSNPSSSAPALSLHVYGGPLLSYDIYPDAATATRERKTTFTEPL
jgi:predicted metal-dependent enzyme (double-stranded beta helix superfamily)